MPAELRHKTISRPSKRCAFSWPCRILKDQPAASHSSISTGSFIMEMLKNIPQLCSKSFPPRENLRYWNDA
jgi:hypothetical protein